MISNKRDNFVSSRPPRFNLYHRHLGTIDVYVLYSSILSLIISWFVKKSLFIVVTPVTYVSKNISFNRSNFLLLSYFIDTYLRSLKLYFHWGSLSCVSIGNILRQNEMAVIVTCDSHYCTCLGHLGWRNTNRNYPYCVPSPKVAKESTVTWLSCVTVTDGVASKCCQSKWSIRATVTATQNCTCFDHFWQHDRTSAMDVVYTLKRQGRTLYGFGG